MITARYTKNEVMKNIVDIMNILRDNKKLDFLLTIKESFVSKDILFELFNLIKK